MSQTEMLDHMHAAMKDLGVEKAWSMRYDPEDGWLVDGPKIEGYGNAWMVVVPLYTGRFHTKQREYELRRMIVKKLDEGRNVLTEHYHGGEDERIGQMEDWLDELAAMMT